ncbi:MAG TPA: serine/threonine-protein kinase [Ktedonobacteraceae bacterium]|nr:serine/threonine-protein kinase [Ktedonobacteraceae bacterium]
MEDLQGSIIDHYHILGLLARGGMSQVYLAHDLQSDQLVAIKLVPSSQSDDYARFRHEVQTLAALQHDHILPVIDYGEYREWYYLSTPYVAHGTLSDRLALGPLSVKEAGEVLEQLTAALQFAHEQGIIHRDIKPSNVLLLDGHHVYLADFGLAKDVGSDPCFTLSGMMIGTPEYMAPELAQERASQRSDIYALGVLLYRMLTGHVPFTASTPLAILLKHVTELPQPPSRYNPTISRAVEKVILRALEKDPRKRFNTARDLMEAYQRAMLVETSRLRALAEYTTRTPLLKISLLQARQENQRRAVMTPVIGGACLLLLLLLSLSTAFSQALSQQPVAAVIHVAPGATRRPHADTAKSMRTTSQNQGTVTAGSIRTTSQNQGTVTAGSMRTTNQNQGAGTVTAKSMRTTSQNQDVGAGQSLQMDWQQDVSGDGQGNQHDKSGQKKGNGGPPGQQKNHGNGQGNGHGKKP